MINDIEQDISYLDTNIQRLNEEWNIQQIPVKKASFFKRLIRKLTYWLYQPMWEQQIKFNQYAAAAICDIYRIQSKLANVIENTDESSHNVCVLEKNDKPRVIQFVSSLNYGDAVGNEVVAFKKALAESGYVTEIFAETIHTKVPADAAKSAKYIPELDKDDIVIYHFSSQCGLFDVVKKLKCRVILRYHNITPPRFFADYDHNAEQATTIGLKQVAELVKYVDLCLPVSEFNKQDLIAMGYTCPMKVIPILIRFSDYERKPNKNVVEKYTDGKVNILFVGRMAPNKKVEDVIFCFAEYKRTYNKDARLFLVGSFNEDDKYYRFLCGHIKKLGVEDVIFPGHIAFDEILAYYTIADAFLCMSEHEGFCVPLVEAMYFHVPIIAYGSTAIPSTLGGSGVLMERKDTQSVGKSIERLILDKEYRDDIIHGQDKRLKDFDNQVITRGFLEVIDEVWGSKNGRESYCNRSASAAQKHHENLQVFAHR